MSFNVGIHRNNAITVILLFIFMLSYSELVEAQIRKTTDGLTPPGMAPGAPAGVYPLSEGETINLYNGQPSFTIPITAGGRGGANISLPIRISPKPWTIKHQRLEVPNPHPLPSGTMQDVFNAEAGWWNDTDSRPYLPGGRMVGRYVTEAVRDCNGSLYFMTTNTRLTFTAPDGTEYNLIDKEKGGSPRFDTCNFTESGVRGNVFVTSDGTAATFYSQSAIGDVVNGGDQQWVQISTNFLPSGYLMLRDGTRYDISNGYVTRMRDRNGNEARYSPILFQFPQGPGIVGWTITDSLNRQIVINYDVSDGVYGVVDRITFKGFGGNDRHFRISYQSANNDWLRMTQPTDPTVPWTAQQLFPQLDNVEGTPGGPLKISTIWLPNGRAYRFKYNVYYELARIELPTDGAIEYDYEGGEPSGTVSGVIGDYLAPRYPVTANSNIPLLGIYRRLRERRIYTGLGLNTLAGITTYSKPVTVDIGLPTVRSNVLVEQWNAAGNICLGRSKHYFQRSAHYSQLKLSSAGMEDLGEAKEIRTDLLDTASSMATLRQVQHEWGFGSFLPNNNYGIAVPINPRLLETKTTIVDGNLVSNQTFGYDEYNNQTESWEYDFGTGSPGGLVRRTQTTYLTNNPAQSNIDYTTDNNIHIRNLPSTISTYNGSGVEIARTWYEYDDYTSYSIQDCPNVVQHESSFHTGYQRRGNLTKVIQFASISPQVQNIYSHNQYDIVGNIVKAIDGNGNATEFDFTDNFGSPDSEATTNTPPNNPNWLGGQKTFAFVTKVRNALGHESYTQQQFPVKRRKIKISNPIQRSILT